MMGPSPGFAYAQRRWQTATCAIFRPVGEPVFDPETGTYTDPDPVEVYSGPCQVHPLGSDRPVEFGEAPVSLRQYEVIISGLSETVRVEDRVTFASDADPQLAGTQMWVMDVKKSSLATNRRLVCEELMS
jgi:hypothetical protein